MAGATPKMMPMAAENPEASATDHRDTDVWINVRKPKDPSVPRSMPMVPPNKLKIIASIRN